MSAGGKIIAALHATETEGVARAVDGYEDWVRDNASLAAQYPRTSQSLRHMPGGISVAAVAVDAGENAAGRLAHELQRHWSDGELKVSEAGGDRQLCLKGYSSYMNVNATHRPQVPEIPHVRMAGGE